MAIPVTTRLLDPFKNFKFTVSFEEGPPIAGISKVSALKSTTETMTYRDGGDISTVVQAPGQTKYEAITLERGLTLDTTFEDWATAAFAPLSHGEIDLSKFRRNMIINLNNLEGDPVRSWFVHQCWVSEYTALPELDASGSAFAFESIVVQHNGFARDKDVTEEVEGFSA